MDRILQNTGAIIQATFTVAGVATDADSGVTVTIVRDDGTILVNAQNTVHNGTGVYQFTLTTAHTSLLDKLTATWTGSIGGVIQSLKTYVEIVGGFLFSIADARKRLPDATAYPYADLVAARTWAETEIENVCGVAFVPRYESEVLNGSGNQRLEPKWPRVRSLRSGTVDGVALAAGDLSTIVVENQRFLTRPFYYWRPWPANVVIRYEHGMDYPPPGITAAALDLAQYKLQTDAGASGVDPRAERLVTDDGTLLLSTAGQTGRFGIPTVDAAIEQWSEIAVW